MVIIIPTVQAPNTELEQIESTQATASFIEEPSTTFNQLFELTSSRCSEPHWAVKENIIFHLNMFLPHIKPNICYQGTNDIRNTASKPCHRSSTGYVSVGDLWFLKVFAVILGHCPVPWLPLGVGSSLFLHSLNIHQVQVYFYHLKASGCKIPTNKSFTMIPVYICSLFLSCQLQGGL